MRPFAQVLVIAGLSLSMCSREPIHRHLEIEA